MRPRFFLLQLLHVVGLHIVALLFAALVRGAQLAVCHALIADASAAVWPAFVRGLWLDNVVACYITLVPLALTLFGALFGRSLRRLTLWWVCVCQSIVLAVAVANIPYFVYFFKPINSSIFEWAAYAQTTAGMLLGEPVYLLYILLGVGVIVLFVVAARGWTRFIASRCCEDVRCLAMTPVALVAVALCAFGIRGRLGYNPIKVSQAYYCDDAMLNQLAISPAFNLLTSVLDDQRRENAALRLMPAREALRAARVWLGAKNDSLTQTVADNGPKRWNVVVVLMESMSYDLLGPLTPTLDSLSRASIFFSRCYSAGTHTNHGLTATLYAFPALMKRNLMKGTVTARREGLPTVLHRAGYQTMFFMPHEGQYDNMNAFFRTNGYDEVYAQEDYPREEVVNAFGVPDKYLFDFTLRRLHTAREPFLATVLTVSNHPPYVLPPDTVFRPATPADPERAIVEYADWALGRFLREARKEKWFARTLFLVVADHGKLVGEPEGELPESYNHIPMFIFGPKVAPRRVETLTAQVDATPTLLGLLGRGYTLPAFGRDVLRHPRRRVVYTADEQIAAREGDSLFVYNHPARRATGDLRLRPYAFALTAAAEERYRH